MVGAAGVEPASENFAYGDQPAYLKFVCLLYPLFNALSNSGTVFFGLILYQALIVQPDVPASG